MDEQSDLRQVRNSADGQVLGEAANRYRVPRSVWTDPRHFLAFGLGAGAAPFAPGTAGTLVAVPLYLLVQHLTLPVYLALTAALFVFGVWLCHATTRDLAVHDHPGIVWDEIVGFLVTMAAAPAGWAWVVSGFLLFRAFDMLKPWPVSWADRRVGGGFGIMLDDLFAGLYAALTLFLIGWLTA